MVQNFNLKETKMSNIILPELNEQVCFGMDLRIVAEAKGLKKVAPKPISKKAIDAIKKILR